LYLGQVGTGEILIEGEGWRVKVPSNMPQEEIKRNIDLPKEKLAVTRRKTKST
jgi:hypothetical protein